MNRSKAAARPITIGRAVYPAKEYFAGYCKNKLCMTFWRLPLSNFAGDGTLIPYQIRN